MEIFKNNRLGESINFFEINGLKVYVMEKKQFSDISASFVIKYGSNDVSFKLESEKNFKKYPLGIAHFLEHKMFDGNEKDEVFRKFSEIGADVNAYTSSNITNYYFSTVDNFEDSMSYLCDMIYGLKLNDESIESEKLIIEQEIKMYDDDPYNKVYRNLLTTMYDEHPIRNDIAGDVNTIKLINKAHLQDCYDNFYVNNNMFLVLVGNVDVNEVKQILNKYIVNKNGKNVIREKFNGFNKINKHYIEEKMGMSIPTNILGFKDSAEPENYIKKLIVFEMIHRLYFRATSNFYEKIYKEEIIDGSYYTEYLNEFDYGHYLLVGDGEKFKKLPEMLLDYYSKYDFSKDKVAFERIKKAMYGNYVNMFNSVDNISHLMIKLIKNNANLFDYFDELKNVTLDDVVYEFKNIFKESNVVYSKVF